MSFDSLSELPQEPESLFPGGFEPVVEELDEDDNPLIFSMKRECSQDQLDYCAGTKYKSGDHTMCKFCVSFPSHFLKKYFHNKLPLLSRVWVKSVPTIWIPVVMI